jgi:hypothetical protein
LTLTRRNCRLCSCSEFSKVRAYDDP